MNFLTNTPTNTTCYHCGDACADIIEHDNHSFCCVGCKSVYALLSQNNLCDYYSIDEKPGIALKSPVAANRFNYLDDEQVQKKLIAFKNEKITKLTFFIPAIHCSSCIWLLERLYKFDVGIVSSRINFLKKTVDITFLHQQITLRKVVELITSLGYEPAINLNDIETEVKKSNNRRLTYQIGVAGFCFGNIMLISFPEYFGLDAFTQQSFSNLFGYLNLVLSLPVFFFSAQDYFITAYKSLRKKFISIDVPLALGIFVLFWRSAYDVVSHTGIGYFDTHAGLVFFLLIGKWFQQKTFDTLSFERDYKSYFPVAVTVIKGAEETTIPVTSLTIGNRILIRNNELIPADAILLKGNATIDFSFVTGETNPVKKVLGEVVYAGGKQMGEVIELEVCKNVSQSYLTQLWNNEHFAKSTESKIKTFQQMVSKYFTLALLVVAFGSTGWWLIFNPALALNAFTSVLIIACPCALALSSPFALGTAMRMLGNIKCYLKSPHVVEQMAKVDTLVFDKTGTLTQASQSKIIFIGGGLTNEEKNAVASLAKNSTHPLSKKIVSFFDEATLLKVENFREYPAKGIEGIISDSKVQLGSFAWLFPHQTQSTECDKTISTQVFVKMNKQCKGYFQLTNAYRNGLAQTVEALNKNYELHLLSGDNESERNVLAGVFKDASKLHFNQQPVDKLNYVDALEQKQKKVMMVGDGLNDAGALKAATVGVSITENTSYFTPASDVIMDASVFKKFPQILQFSKNTLRVIHVSFVISLVYNIIGLSFAVQGMLSPLIAAILMPVSSVTVIAFTTITTSLLAKNLSTINQLLNERNVHFNRM